MIGKTYITYRHNGKVISVPIGGSNDLGNNSSSSAISFRRPALQEAAQ